MYGGQTARRLRQEVREALRGAPRSRRDIQGQSRQSRPAENVSYKLYNMEGQRYYTYTPQQRSFLSARQHTAWMRNSCNGWKRRCGMRKEQWKICYFHHPLYSNAARHGSAVDLRVVLEPIFLKSGVDVVFSGHDHVYERVKPQKGIYYFVSGSAGQLRKGNMRPDERDSRLLRSGSELHAGRGRRRRDVLLRRSRAPGRQ